MAPKDNVQEEEPLQAVIITDSFNNRYKPLTLDKPRVNFINFYYKIINLNYNNTTISIWNSQKYTNYLLFINYFYYEINIHWLYI